MAAAPGTGIPGRHPARSMPCTHRQTRPWWSSAWTPGCRRGGTPRRRARPRCSLRQKTRPAARPWCTPRAAWAPRTCTGPGPHSRRPRTS
ncbi:hypothetical protein F751_5438 [Auxenochlorella protothecoides]|uniref:Uncharacterized protein n=1 Tax=Auxenochlorella protothecoides TaxID=3075 RepID=A0A087SQ69_AUXPR|nr:hypothetical protein F751_5438 [Auxenochlorella protothecoides]KFM27873.1 hypothetical protein F751_5438 [Auxenochlorella protothecoides]